jgi:hypothetical protein
MLDRHGFYEKYKVHYDNALGFFWVLEMQQDAGG